MCQRDSKNKQIVQKFRALFPCLQPKIRFSSFKRRLILNGNQCVWEVGRGHRGQKEQEKGQKGTGKTALGHAFVCLLMVPSVPSTRPEQAPGARAQSTCSDHALRAHDRIWVIFGHRAPTCTGDSGRFWSLGAILGPLALQLRVVILQLDPALAPIGQAGFYVRARFAFYGSPHTAQAQSSGVPRIPTELDKGAKSLFPDAC